MKFLTVCLSVAALLAPINGFGTLCGRLDQNGKRAFPPDTEMPANLKIAFIGDAGHETAQEQVLNLIKTWGAAAVIHSGDFEYDNDADLFESQINKVLGPNYPYFASIGNHDVLAWNGHKQRLEDRLERIGATDNCVGEYGVNMACSWNGLFFVLSGAGTRGSGHADYADEAFASSTAAWKVGSWHKNQRLMQIGGKLNEAGWEIYDTTRKHGAILATGHEHSYCRSHMMSNFENQDIANTNATLNLKVGESFVFVSGLGGKDIRDWNDGLVSNPWWAAYGASDNGIKEGALLCTFNINGILNKAHCFFQDISGKIWDDFDMISSLPTNKEELHKMLKQQEAKESGFCKSRWVEVPIRRSTGDVHEDEVTHEVAQHSKVLSFIRHSSVSLAFDSVPLKKGDKIKHAFLQVYGAHTDRSVPHFRISGHSHRFGGRPTKSSVAWKEDDEDFEVHTVWVSPDLKEIVSELIQEDGWKEGDAVTLKITGKAGKAFYSFDESPCVAPTLALEIEGDC